MSDEFERMILVRREIEHLYGLFTTILPDGRAKSLTLTKLDEARLWAHEALALQVDASGPPEEYAPLRPPPLYFWDSARGEAIPNPAHPSNQPTKESDDAQPQP